MSGEIRAEPEADTTADGTGAQLLRRIMQSDQLRMLQMLPGIFWILFFLIIPFLIIVVYSFQPEAPISSLSAVKFTVANYAELFNTPIYQIIFLDSFVIAVKTTVITLLLTFPAAYFIAFTESERKNLYLLLVILPFWMNIVVRTYAWRQVFSHQGLVNHVLVNFLGQQPIELMYTQTVIVIGLVHVFFPFMIIPIYSSLSRIDRSQIESAQNLGANKLEAFYEVTLPQSLPGISGGVLIVFILSFGAYVTPILLGGQKNSMIANIIGSMFLEIQAWEFGAAVAVVFTLIVVASVYLFSRIVGLGDLYGEGAV